MTIFSSVVLEENENGRGKDAWSQPKLPQLFLQDFTASKMPLRAMGRHKNGQEICIFIRHQLKRE